ncbi:MAG: BMP family ABC transporter substrate-binding protein [Actinomycetes bacterium]|jgi:basic membrane protein A
MAKRLLSFFLSLLLTTTVLTPPAKAATVKIAIAYEVGGKGDNGVNDLASVGLERAIKKYKLSRLDIREQITDGTLGDRITRVRFLAKSKYQLIICVGPGYADTVKRIANEFPNTQFAIIDDESVGLTNVSNLSFATSEAVYFAAAAMASVSKSGKIGFISEKSSVNVNSYGSAFTRGAVAANPKIKVSNLLVDQVVSEEVKKQVSSGVDQILSTWSKSDEVISTVAALNSGANKSFVSGLLPEQYFLNFSAGKKNQYLVIEKRFDIAVEQIIGTELAGKNMLDILDANKGIYGHRYNLKDGGLSVNLVNGGSFSTKTLKILEDLKAGRVKSITKQ